MHKKLANYTRVQSRKYLFKDICVTLFTVSLIWVALVQVLHYSISVGRRRQSRTCTLWAFWSVSLYLTHLIDLKGICFYNLSNRGRLLSRVCSLVASSLITNSIFSREKLYFHSCGVGANNSMTTHDCGYFIKTFLTCLSLVESAKLGSGCVNDIGLIYDRKCFSRPYWPVKLIISVKSMKSNGRIPDW